MISTGKAHTSIEEDGELSGIKAAVRSKGRGKGKGKALGGVEWELDLSGSGMRRLERREELPVVIVLNLVCLWEGLMHNWGHVGIDRWNVLARRALMSQVPESKVHFLDATLQEELACPDKLLAFFNKEGKLCGLRMEGDSGLDIDRIRPLLRVSRKV